jgi:hypothetical protein
LTPAPSSKPGASAPVRQLLYRSRSVNGAESVLQMSDILAQARPANARDGITGVLTAVNGSFVQIIEGGERVIDGLMARLLRDPRHADLVVLDQRTVASRWFADWDMVSPRLAADELSVLALLLQDEGARLSDYASLLGRAVARQEAALEGRGHGRPGDLRRSPPPERTAKPQA